MALLDVTSDPLVADLDYANLSAANQAKAAALAEAGSQLIEKYCNRTFASTVYTDELYNGTGYNEIYVRNPPLTTLTQVVIKRLDDSNTYDDISNQFETNEDTGRISFTSLLSLDTVDYCFPRGFNNVLIDYTGGYATIPEPIQLVLADFIINAYGGIGGADLLSEKIGQYFYKKKETKAGQGSGSSAYEGLSQYHAILSLYKLRKA